MKIGDNIKNARLMKNFTQEYVAKELGISRQAYSNIERNQADIYLSNLFRIASVLETTPERLLRQTHNN